MRKPWLILIMTAISLVSVAADDFYVNGRILEADSEESCPGAQYQIYNQLDTISPLIINVADINGVFHQLLDSPGNYLIKVSYVGLVGKTIPFTTSVANHVADLGDIRLETESEILGEVIVTAKKKLVESDGATLTYNVENDPQAYTNSVIEMLRKIPMVSVDAEDNIRVNGDTNFKILVNGKEDPMLSGDVKNVLKAMPAATIKKIEVITEPGAKYDAEGTGGILNIITATSQSVNGYLVNLSGRISSDFYGASVYARGKIKNVTANATVNYLDRFDLGYFIKYKSLIENFTDDDNRFQDQSSKMKLDFNFLSASLALSWEPDPKNLFSAQVNLGKHDLRQKQIENISMSNALNVSQWSLKRNTITDYDNLWLAANVSYQHTFGKDGHNLILSYVFGYGKDNNDQTNFSYDEINYHQPDPWRLQTSYTNNFLHTLQLDYANPLNEHNLIEAGMKGNWSRDRNLSLPYYGQSENDLTPSGQEEVNVEQYKDVMALYASYTANFGHWNAKAGLRYEYTFMGLNYKVGRFPDFSSRLNDLVPNVALSYKIKDATNLRLAYQMRISRPGISQLNPFENTMNVNQIVYGNPDLKSEKANSISLTYTNYGGRLGGSASISYERVDNQIESYAFFLDNVLHTTYANIGHRQSTRLNINIQWSPLPTLNISTFISGAYIDLRAKSPELKASNSGFTGNLNMNIDYTLPFRLRISAFGGANAKNINIQTTSSGFHYYGLSLSRSFLKNDILTLTAFGQNFITPYRRFNIIQESDSFRSTINLRQRQWSAGFSISIRLGALHSDVRKTNAELEMIEGNSSPQNAGTSPISM